jgi:lysyl-tRNA synthetase, class II
MAIHSLRGAHHADSVVVAARDGDGIRAFLHLVPSYGRPAMSLSFMRRDRDTPNGSMEFVVVRAIEFLRDRRVEEVSLTSRRSRAGSRGPADGSSAHWAGPSRSPTRSSR